MGVQSAKVSPPETGGILSKKIEQLELVAILNQSSSVLARFHANGAETLTGIGRECLEELQKLFEGAARFPVTDEEWAALKDNPELKETFELDLSRRDWIHKASLFSECERDHKRSKLRILARTIKGILTEGRAADEDFRRLMETIEKLSKFTESKRRTSPTTFRRLVCA